MKYSEEEKQAIYKKWIERGRPWFSLDPSKEATPEERDIVVEMNKRQVNKTKREINLEKRTEQIRRKYKGKISGNVFELN